jgi:hypothetical protein
MRAGGGIAGNWADLTMNMKRILETPSGEPRAERR